MKRSKSVISFLLRWDIKQFTIGFLVGIIISLLYNSVMYLNSNSLINETEKFLDDIILNKPQDIYTSILEKNPCNYGSNGPRILCTVFTYKKNFNLKAQYVDQTWGKRCDKTIYMSGYVNETEKHLYSHMNIVYLNLTDTNRLNLTSKTIETLLYANRIMIEDFDWILKADDDTYVIMENLKKFLRYKCSSDMTYYGFRYKPLLPDTFSHDFNSGGAGYVISNKAVRKFSENYLGNNWFCRNTTGSEDVDIAKCMKEINVLPGDSRDEQGLERFHPLSYESMWNISPANRTYNHSRFALKKKAKCCSTSSITFHYTSGDKALQLDYLLYTLRPQISYI